VEPGLRRTGNGNQRERRGRRHRWSVAAESAQRDYRGSANRTGGLVAEDVYVSAPLVFNDARRPTIERITRGGDSGGLRQRDEPGRSTASRKVVAIERPADEPKDLGRVEGRDHRPTGMAFKPTRRHLFIEQRGAVEVRALDAVVLHVPGTDHLRIVLRTRGPMLGNQGLQLGPLACAQI